MGQLPPQAAAHGQQLALCAGGIAGGLCGGWLVHRLPEKIMRGFVVTVGAVLTVWMFVR